MLKDFKSLVSGLNFKFIDLFINNIMNFKNKKF